MVSEPHPEPSKTPCSQSNASFTSGMVPGRRPPKRIAESGPPRGFCQSGSITGHCDAGAVKREFGCAPFLPLPGVHSLPSQSMPFAGAGTPMFSHHTSPSGVRTTFVKIVFFSQVLISFGFDAGSGSARRDAEKARLRIHRVHNRPSLPRRIQAMSSPRVVTFQPGRVGCIIARLVLPQALGNAAVM